MEGYEGILKFETDKIKTDIIDAKEMVKVKGIVSSLHLYDGNKEELTKIYTQILLSDDVSDLLMKISKEPIFVKHFPELYTKNKYGEDVINCQQNSIYHKYGVFKHILHTIESAGNSQIPIGDWQKKVLKWTMFLHDIGKPFVKVINEDESESFAGHDDVSVELSIELLNRFYFSEEEKKIILTLIKYHDKFLNEGEITYDNMKFLANEFENNKDLFNLLIEVKDADAKSKNIDVYNKYKLTKNKYLTFLNEYFNNIEEDLKIVSSNINKEELVFNNNSNLILNDTDNNDISSFELDILIENVLNKKNIMNMYQPMVDLYLKKVHGYEVFSTIDFNKKIDIYEFFNYAKDIGKYEKIQQVLLINGINKFESISVKEADTLFISIDYESYYGYINKPRIYDMMSRNKIVICFNNYEKKDLVEFQKTINLIHENKGFVALDNFGLGSLSTDDLNILKLDYIIPEVSIIKEISTNLEKQKYILELLTYSISREINIIILGIKDSDTLNTCIKLGVRYVQGDYFSKSEQVINLYKNKIEALLLDKSNDKII